MIKSPAPQRTTRPPRKAGLAAIKEIAGRSLMLCYGSTGMGMLREEHIETFDPSPRRLIDIAGGRRVAREAVRNPRGQNGAAVLHLKLFYRMIRREVVDARERKIDAQVHIEERLELLHLKRVIVRTQLDVIIEVDATTRRHGGR